jgi:hypothetical protein
MKQRLTLFKQERLFHGILKCKSSVALHLLRFGEDTRGSFGILERSLLGCRVARVKAAGAGRGIHTSYRLLGLKEVSCNFREPAAILEDPEAFIPLLFLL